jgi:iduronate 2-sulfatase
MSRTVLLLSFFLLVPPIDLAQSAEKLNVLLIVSDDLTNAALGCYHGPIAISPNIDKLAHQGVQFNKAYCQFPLCNPSRASFLTGMRPDQIKIYENATQFRKNAPNLTTLPQTFRKAGYYVARVGKLYHYGVPGQIGTDGLDDAPSWEKVINPKGKDKDDESKIFTLQKGQFGGTLSWLADEGEDADFTDGKAAAETVKLLEANRDKPFFIACGFYRPHTPYVAPKQHFPKFPIGSIRLPEVKPNHRDGLPAMAFGSAKKEQDSMTDDLRKEAIQAYHASTFHMDVQVGILLDTLQKLKLADKTIVVFISDHGYHLGEHGLWQKMSLFENSTRVPLLIYDPRSKGNGKISNRTVELVDLHPTLADLCELPAPKELTGKSVKPLLNDPNAAWDKPAITQVTRGPGKQKSNAKNAGPTMGYSIRTERFRYTEWDQGTKGTQLYDYETDPQELTNLASDPKLAETVAALKKQLHERIKSE